jgi:hypothetical protein
MHPASSSAGKTAVYRSLAPLPLRERSVTSRFEPRHVPALVTKRTPFTMDWRGAQRGAGIGGADTGHIHSPPPLHSLVIGPLTRRRRLGERRRRWFDPQTTEVISNAFLIFGHISYSLCSIDNIASIASFVVCWFPVRTLLYRDKSCLV